MQIKKQGNRAIIDMKNAKREELRMVAEALMKIGNTLQPHGMTLTIRPKQVECRARA